MFACRDQLRQEPSESLNDNMSNFKTKLKLKIIMKEKIYRIQQNVDVINFAFIKIILNKFPGNPSKRKKFQEM